MSKTKRRRKPRARPQPAPEQSPPPSTAIVLYRPQERLRTPWEIMEGICRRVIGATDGHSWLIEDAARAEGITGTTAREWILKDAQMAAMYARARELSAETLEMEAIRVARSFNPAPKHFDPRLLVDTLKWAAAKRRPRDYSERAEILAAAGGGITVIFSNAPLGGRTEAAEVAPRQRPKAGALAS